MKETFNDVIERIEILPDEEQEEIVGIIRKRLIEHRRESLAREIAHVRRQYRRGSVRRGTVDDLMNEIAQ
ncbi:MAG: hypothetical protein A2Z34_10490 [Planctomycetes bacterium RBG_16_59_8]|nr:MAG: hypothetical protein A2Z34_10490 [Planctomycetes bacterium RBG_16_59_8]